MEERKCIGYVADRPTTKIIASPFLVAAGMVTDAVALLAAIEFDVRKTIASFLAAASRARNATVT